jgi:thermostable 8-oxoguanine DNA glycosylase
VARVVTPAPAVATPAMSSEDQQVLNTVAARFPSQKANYRKSLEDANLYIRDAEQSIRNDPNDVYSRELLINAYEQKQMLYDLAVYRNGEQ